MDSNDARLLSDSELDRSIEKYISKHGKRRLPNIFRELHKKAMQLDVSPINLSGGLPHHSVFPIKGVTLDLDDGVKVSLTPEVLKTALQYQGGLGYKPLQETIKAMTLEVHNPPLWNERDCLVVSGAQEALGKIAAMLLDEGDGVILTEHSYTTFVDGLNPMKPQIFTVPCDEQGMIIEKLESVLMENSQAVKFKILYVNSSGSNPSGITTSLERRKKMYDLACRYDFLIIEDDPYSFLNLDGEALPPSFLQLDVEKRVLRVDTFSKCLAPGLRVGWVTAPTGFIVLIQRHIHSDTIHPSGLSQAAIHAILTSWGADGFESQLSKLRSFYRAKRDSIIRAVERHLTGLAEWIVPECGMFLWIKILGLKDTKEFILKDLLECGVMFCPGSCFEKDVATKSQYIRCSFSSCSDEEFDEAFKILAREIRKKISSEK